MDLDGIFAFLVESYRAFGEDDDRAFRQAAQRVVAIRDDVLELGQAPHQGTRDTTLGPHIRHVTKDRAIFYFDVDAEAERLNVLAIFWDGQDHGARMIERLSAGRGSA